MREKKPHSSIIFGVDPGTAITGYGVIKCSGRKLETIDYGCIRTSTSKPLSYRYRQIFESLCTLLDKYQPTSVSVETQYMSKNVQSAMKLGMARGMVLLAAALREIPISEYSPTKVKSSVVGNGLASKEQVQKMVQSLLGLQTIPTPEDAADALALAICHSHFYEIIS